MAPGEKCMRCMRRSRHWFFVALQRGTSRNEGDWELPDHIACYRDIGASLQGRAQTWLAQLCGQTIDNRSPPLRGAAATQLFANGVSWHKTWCRSLSIPHSPTMNAPTLEQVRRYAIGRSLFKPTTLRRAVCKLGFVQADPIRAPARAQDLTLRHRVKDYRAGDLERVYARLPLEEAFFINYGFLDRETELLLHPRSGRNSPWDASRRRHANALLDFVRERGEVHPRDVDAHFGHGSVRNYWGGTSNLTTHLLDALHYRGLLRVVRRDSGIRTYAAREVAPPVRDAKLRAARLDALVDVVVQAYAPLPAASLGYALGRLRYAVPQWRPQLKAAIERARARLSHARLGGQVWYWPAKEQLHDRWAGSGEALYLLTPFDPIVWDRRRFHLLWGWDYRFEAYTPVAKRKLGYYALPLLWRDDIVAWANITTKQGSLDCQLGFLHGRPREPAFERALEAELASIRSFLTSRKPER